MASDRQAKGRFSVWEIRPGRWRWVVSGVGFITGGYAPSEDQAKARAKTALGLDGGGD